MIRTRPAALLLPVLALALALAGCCCERPCAPRGDPSPGHTNACPSPAPATDPVRVSVGAGLRVKVPDAGAPLPIDMAAPRAGTPAVMVVDVADLAATISIDTLVQRLRDALPGTEVNRRGTGTIVVKGTPEAHAKVGAWLALGRMDAMPPK